MYEQGVEIGGNLNIRMKGIGNVKKVILVMSGKGGVGKSTFSVLLAHCLSQKKLKIGLLDLDLCGPSIGKMFAGDSKNTAIIKGTNDEWIPVSLKDNLVAISMAYFLENEDDAVIWRGPKKNAMIKELIENVSWGNLDYLIVDTPPGTSDEHITLAEYLYNVKNVGAILVTTPQKVATNDVRREITFCRKTNLPIIGIVENMSFFVCSHCHYQNKLLLHHNEQNGGGTVLANEFNLKLLGNLPYCYIVCARLDKGIDPFHEKLDDIDQNIIHANQCNHKELFNQIPTLHDTTTTYNIFLNHFNQIMDNIYLW